MSAQLRDKLAVLRPQMLSVKCPYCGSDAKLADSKAIYGVSYGNVWLCWPCRAWVGVHKGPNPKANTPLGTLANAPLRRARHEAHAAFDPLWRGDRRKRETAYHWLAQAMGISLEKCHIGMFDVEQCQRVVRLVAETKKRGGLW